MKIMITPLALLLLFFSLNCSDMAKKVSDPEGINPDDGNGTTYDTEAPVLSDFTLTSDTPTPNPTITFTL